MLRALWRGRQSPRLQVVGDPVRQSPVAIFRYTIVYKLYGLFIYSISYVCMYLYEYMYKKKRIIFRSFCTLAGVLVSCRIKSNDRKLRSGKYLHILAKYVVCE